jgi:glycosyltransferase involved in cell wall biosynthesis
VTQGRKKVCIVTASLELGGAERASAIQSIMFYDLGYDVSIVTVKSGVTYNFKGEIFDLGQFKDTSNSTSGRISRLFKLRKFLKKNKFDFIVDNRARNQSYRELVITKFIYNVPTIYVIHSYKEDTAFTKYTWLNKYLYKNKQMVVVSEKGREKFKKMYQLNTIDTIYNGFDFDENKELSNQKVDDNSLKDYIIYCGRINDKVKNLKLLLKVYKLSKLAEYKIKLLILGDGQDLNLIKEYAENLGVEKNVIFKGFSKNPFPYFKNAKFTVLTSRSEGFSMVLAESLGVGTPVISVNCDAGPKEIITHEFNGLLVENFNEEALAKAFDSFIEDNELYQKCKKNAESSVGKFSVVNVSKAWENILNKLL